MKLKSFSFSKEHAEIQIILGKTDIRIHFFQLWKGYLLRVIVDNKVEEDFVISV